MAQKSEYLRNLKSKYLDVYEEKSDNLEQPRPINRDRLYRADNLQSKPQQQNEIKYTPRSKQFIESDKQNLFQPNNRQKSDKIIDRMVYSSKSKDHEQESQSKQQLNRGQEKSDSYNQLRTQLNKTQDKSQQETYYQPRSQLNKSQDRNNTPIESRESRIQRYSQNRQNENISQNRQNENISQNRQNENKKNEPVQIFSPLKYSKSQDRQEQGKFDQYKYYERDQPSKQSNNQIRTIDIEKQNQFHEKFDHKELQDEQVIEQARISVSKELKSKYQERQQQNNEGFLENREKRHNKELSPRLSQRMQTDYEQQMYDERNIVQRNNLSRDSFKNNNKNDDDRNQFQGYQNRDKFLAQSLIRPEKVDVDDNNTSINYQHSYIKDNRVIRPEKIFNTKSNLKEFQDDRPIVNQFQTSPPQSPRNKESNMIFFDINQRPIQKSESPVRKVLQQTPFQKDIQYQIKKSPNKEQLEHNLNKNLLEQIQQLKQEKKQLQIDLALKTDIEQELRKRNHYNEENMLKLAEEYKEQIEKSIMTHNSQEIQDEQLRKTLESENKKLKEENTKLQETLDQNNSRKFHAFLLKQFDFMVKICVILNSPSAEEFISYRNDPLFNELENQDYEEMINDAQLTIENELPSKLIKENDQQTQQLQSHIKEIKTEIQNTQKELQTPKQINQNQQQIQQIFEQNIENSQQNHKNIRQDYREASLEIQKQNPQQNLDNKNKLLIQQNSQQIDAISKQPQLIQETKEKNEILNIQIKQPPQINQQLSKTDKMLLQQQMMMQQSGQNRVSFKDTQQTESNNTPYYEAISKHNSNMRNSNESNRNSFKENIPTGAIVEGTFKLKIIGITNLQLLNGSENKCYIEIEINHQILKESYFDIYNGIAVNQTHEAETYVKVQYKKEIPIQIRLYTLHSSRKIFIGGCDDFILSEYIQKSGQDIKQIKQLNYLDHRNDILGQLNIVLRFDHK